MLLVMDVGNTNIGIGVYRGEELQVHWTAATRPERTADELGTLLLELFHHRGLQPEEVRDMAIACVVPPLLPALEEMAARYFGCKPLVVGPGTRTGIAILADNPREVGADRIVNTVAGYTRYGGPLILVDFGTATTFDAVSERGEYLGGAIAPGIGISMEALFLHTAKLPRVELGWPGRVIGKNTVASMQSGVLYGYVGLVKEIVARMRQELGQPALVIATGGAATLIAKETDIIDRVDPLLTLEGLRILYERNLSPEGTGMRPVGPASSP